MQLLIRSWCHEESTEVRAGSYGKFEMSKFAGLNLKEEKHWTGGGTHFDIRITKIGPFFTDATKCGAWAVL